MLDGAVDWQLGRDGTWRPSLRRKPNLDSGVFIYATRDVGPRT
ncbi:hypothetical protein [Modestobacter sp. I12A-02662]